MIWRHTFSNSLGDDPRRYHNLTIVIIHASLFYAFSSVPSVQLGSYIDHKHTWHFHVLI